MKSGGVNVMNNPKVSIIVPCYKQAEYLPETLDSVLAQTYSNWECIIVNDGSPDNTEEVAQAYCQKDARFHYVFRENGGLSAARNTGVQHSCGEFILPLDSDDLIKPEYLAKAMARFEEYPETTLVYCQACFFGLKEGEWILWEYSYSEILLHTNQIFCSAFYRRSDFDRVNGYDESLKRGLEDWNFWLHILTSASVVYQIPEILFCYRQRENSMIVQANRIQTSVFLEVRLRNLQKQELYFPNLVFYKYFEYDLEPVFQDTPEHYQNIVKAYVDQIVVEDKDYSWKHSLINKIAKWLGLSPIYYNKKWLGG